MNTIYWLKELRKDDVEIVGKKCANLGEMTGFGLPVPPGFALSFQAYEQFVAETKLEAEIGRLASEASSAVGRLDEVEALSQRIRSTVESRSMPQALREDILQHYHKLSEQMGQVDVEVAVRSSGAVSMPGSYETSLHVRGDDALLSHIVKVWSSTFNARSLAHRLEKGMSLTTPIGVAVIKMVNAKCAGVLFTTNPVTGDRSKMIVESNWGLGESVVSGRVGPDRFRLNRILSTIEERILGTKEEECLPDRENGGVVFQPVLEERRKDFCLDDDELMVLLQMGKRVEKFFGGAPQDIEWAIDRDLPQGNNLILLQVRPEQTYKARQEKQKKEGQDSPSSSTDYISSFLTRGVKLEPDQK